MKKTTAFARRRARQGLPASSMVLCAKDYRKPWLTANGSRDYSDEANRADFDRIMLDIRLQLERITSGVVPQDDVEPHDLLAHVVGITKIRVFDIGAAGTEHDKAKARTTIAALNQAAQALQRMRERWQRLGVWGLDGSGLQLVRDAIDTCEVVLHASTPRQMELAQTQRLTAIKRMQHHAR